MSDGPEGSRERTGPRTRDCDRSPKINKNILKSQCQDSRDYQQRRMTLLSIVRHLPININTFKFCNAIFKQRYHFKKVKKR